MTFDGATEDRRGANVDWLVLALLVAPFVVGIVAVLVGVGPSFHGFGDTALNEMRIRDLGTHSVLLGPYSRDAWNHPGPAMFYALLLPYRLLGSHSSGLLVGALLINGVSVAGTFAIARRVGGRTLALLIALALSVLMLNLGAEFLRNPWNPDVTVLPFALLFVAGWGLAVGRVWMAPVVALVASFCVQTHVGYLLPAAVLVAWGCIGCAMDPEGLIRGRRSRDLRPLTPLLVPALVTVAVLLVLWVPPLIDQFTGSGNLGHIVAYFTRDDPTRGVGIAARIVGEEFTVTPDWIFGHEPPIVLSVEPPSSLRTPLPILALLFIGVAALTWRRLDRARRQLTIGIGISVVAAVVALARTPGLIYDYRLRWLWVLGAFAVVSTLWMIATAWCSAPAPRRVLHLMLAASLTVTTVIGGIAATTPDPPDPRFARVMKVINRQVLAHLPEGAVTLRASSWIGFAYLDGLLLRLEKAGVDVRVEPDAVAEPTFGKHRLGGDGTPRATLTVAVNAMVNDEQPRPGQRIIAAWAQEPPQQRDRDAAELVRLVKRGAAGDRSAQLLERITLLVRRQEAVAVFFSPAA